MNRRSWLTTHPVSCLSAKTCCWRPPPARSSALCAPSIHPPAPFSSDESKNSGKRRKRHGAECTEPGVERRPKGRAREDGGKGCEREAKERRWRRMEEEKKREGEREREGSERKLYTKCTCAVLPQVVRRNARSFRYYVMQRGKRVQGYGEDQLSTSLGCPGGAPLSLEFGTTLRDHRRKLRKKPSPPATSSDCPLPCLPSVFFASCMSAISIIYPYGFDFNARTKERTRVWRKNIFRIGIFCLFHFICIFFVFTENN